jgi:hypothetical protein
MESLAPLIRTRLLPALLTAAGVALVTAGLITYTDPTLAGIGPSPSPAPVVTPRPIATPSAAPSATPSGAAPPSASPSAAVERTVTRVAVPLLRIDLPVIRQPDPSYPSCNVAMYHEAFGAPGGEIGPYLYAHARTGMFLPLLEASKVNGGRAMEGMLVQVWTSDDRLFLYEITQIRRHVPADFDLGQLLDDGPNLLWLQTSEGPNSSYPKLQVVATLLSESEAAAADAHPTARPVDCR